MKTNNTNLNHAKYSSARAITTLGIVASLGIATVPAIISATSVDGDVQLNTEVSSSLAMKIASPNDINPDCMIQSGVTYGTANRYATSNGSEGSKQIDGFDGTVGGADELNTNTSCATLSMNPNSYDSTYSDITVYTNSPNGYTLTLQSVEGSSPNLVNTSDPTYYIPAGTLTEQDGTGSQAGQKVVPGGQNAWAYKADNGIATNWTALTTTANTIKAYDTETNNGNNTRVTYGISAGNNPTGKYATTLTYTATMFDSSNPYVGDVTTESVPNLSISPRTLKIARNQTKTLTVTPAEGYYLSDVDCPEGYDCSNYTTDKSDPASATTQAISVKNESASSSTTASVGLEVTPIQSMQDFSASTHAGDASGTVYEGLIDSRDGKEYTAAKLADGKIWMTKDLQLDGGRTLTSADSDVTTNFPLAADNNGTWCTTASSACDNQSLMTKQGAPHGYYYNWYAATAGTGRYETSSGDATASICPKGWHLPSSSEFVALDQAYGGSGSTRDDTAQINKFLAAPLSFNYTGLRNGGTTSGPNDDARYWSRTPYNSARAYSLVFIPNGSFYPQTDFGKNLGFAVRCVALS